MLKTLYLENFRNYEKYSLELAKTTILIGPNGVGKTNILEAIYLLATGRSWRTRQDERWIKWGKDFVRVKAKLDNDQRIEIFLGKGILSVIANPEPSRGVKQSFEGDEIASSQTPRNDITGYRIKQVKINDVKKRVTDLLGKMTVVLFSPETIQMIDGSPILRRRFLDILICQTDHKYTLALLELGKIIRGRNKLLFYIKIGRSQEKELAFWDEKLVILGSFIIKKRQKTIKFLNENLSQIYRIISGEDETFKILYKPSVFSENFATELESARAREIERTNTLLGPHRDDLVFLLDSKDIATFGSRGEYRSVILALKIAELAYLENSSETKPILLLDDIFSELDKTRRLHLGKIIVGQQTIITTTDFDHIEKGLKEKAKIVELKI